MDTNRRNSEASLRMIRHRLILGRLTSLAAVIVLLAACTHSDKGHARREAAAPPQFHTKKSTETLRRVVAQNRLHVAPLTLGGAEGSAQRTEILIERLRFYGIQARLAEGKEESDGLLLRASGRLDPLSSRRGEITVFWEVIAADGQVVYSVNQRDQMSLSGWHSARRSHIQPFLDTAVKAIAERFAPQRFHPQLRATRILLLPMIGLEGRKALILEDKLTAALANQGIATTALPQAGDLLLRARYSIGNQRPSIRIMRIVWTLGRTENQDVIGTISQEDTVLTTSLEHKWPSIAEKIADQTARGIQQILKQAAQEGKISAQ